MSTYGVAAPPTDSQATVSLVLGILSLFCCGIVLGPVAIFMANASRRKIQAGGGAIGGAGLASAGLVLGIVGTVLWVLGILFYVLVFVVSRSNVSG
jgi:hypothetical protein